MANEEVKPLKVIDYINRVQVLELLGNRADSFSEPPMDNDDFTKLKLVVELETEIRKLPTIDAVEVCRCKDCEYRYTKNCSAKHERADWDYCSHGKQKED